MFKIAWHGNDGYCFPEPGKVKRVKCGICGVFMSVKRNVLGCISFVGAIGGIKHIHDRFTCPNTKKDWHEKIQRWKNDVYEAEMDGAVDYEEKRALAEKKIRAILAAHAAR